MHTRTARFPFGSFFELASQAQCFFQFRRHFAQGAFGRAAIVFRLYSHQNAAFSV
jgi:hypothetical protein